MRLGANAPVKQGKATKLPASSSTPPCKRPWDDREIRGNVADVVFVARQLGAAYRHAVEWSQRVKRAHIEEHFEPAVHEMSLFSDSLIEQIGSFGPDLLTRVEVALADLSG
jgi:hypothetical protein